MPIQTAVPVEIIDQERFHAIDRQVTGIAFDIHNEFGRYLDEKLYQRELAQRCRQVGLHVEPEMHIAVVTGDFKKDYFADHLINRSVVVETKAAAALCPAHRGQALNYLFLCGLQHATLLNFRTERVQHEFVSTRLTRADRARYDLNMIEWKPLSSQCEQMYEALPRLLADWGAFLDPVLYRDALSHLVGGVESEIPIRSAGEPIGTQKVHTLSGHIAFSVTAYTHKPDTVLEHQRRFLRHTDLRAVQWINFNRHRIDLRTITK
jgi:GxxExxY protein